MVSQVVLSPSQDGRPDLHISPVSGVLNSTPASGGELHLGSQDLIRLASYASTHGFRVASFMIADAYLAPISEDEQADVSNQMVKMLEVFGVSELEAAMSDEYDGLYVVGVNLIAAASGRRVIVRRRGYVDTSIVNEAERLLRSAWQELHLS